MFEDDRSDFGVPVAGFFIMGFAGLLLALLLLNAEFEFTTDAYNNIPLLMMIVGVIGIVVGAAAVRKAYLVEGFSFGMFSLFLFLIPDIAVSGATGGHLLLGIIVLLAFLFIAFLSYSGGVLDLAIVDVILGIAFLLIVGVEGMALAGGILVLIAAVICIYVCLSDWLFVQDIMREYEAAVCECGCGDEDCDCEDECHCHDKE